MQRWRLGTYDGSRIIILVLSEAIRRLRLQPQPPNRLILLPSHPMNLDPNRARSGSSRPPGTGRAPSVRHVAGFRSGRFVNVRRAYKPSMAQFKQNLVRLQTVPVLIDENEIVKPTS